jgi:hypothetical protein
MRQDKAKRPREKGKETTTGLQARLAYTATEVPSCERAARMMAQTWGTEVKCFQNHWNRER